MKPITFLDVDGVLHDRLAIKAIRSSAEPNAMADRFDVDVLITHGRKLAVPKYMGALIRGIVANSEVWWCTTWRHRANDELRLHLGLPVLPVCDDGTNGVGPAWKIGMVADLLAQPVNRGRPAFWIEDFSGIVPDVGHPVHLIDTTEAGVLRPGDLPVTLLPDLDSM